jgi:hypothetical protein
MVDSAFDRIMCCFSDYAINKYHEEECRFGEVSDGDIQTGTHKIISIDRENIKADVNPLAVPYLLEHKTKEHIKRMELKMKGFPHDSENKR